MYNTNPRVIKRKGFQSKCSSLLVLVLIQGTFQYTVAAGGKKFTKISCKKIQYNIE